jgi:hypothetical protein
MIASLLVIGCLMVGLFFALAWRSINPRDQNLITLRGTLEPGVEAGCVILRTEDGVQFLLTTWSDYPPAGTRVVVGGYSDSSMASYCMQDSCSARRLNRHIGTHPSNSLSIHQLRDWFSNCFHRNSWHDPAINYDDPHTGHPYWQHLQHRGEPAMLPAMPCTFIFAHIPLRSTRNRLHRFDHVLRCTEVFPAAQRYLQSSLDNGTQWHVCHCDRHPGYSFIMELRLVLRSETLHAR